MKQYLLYSLSFVGLMVVCGVASCSAPHYQVAAPPSPPIGIGLPYPKK